MEYLFYAALLIFAYLVGSIPSGLVVGRLSRNIDIREFGSGNIGAANTLRTLGWKASVCVFISDIAKAVIAVLAARLLTGSLALEAMCGFAAIVGHNWSVYIGFKGGRGVSSSLGAMLVMMPLVATVGLAVGLGFMAVFRYVSLGSVVGAVLIAAIALVFGGTFDVAIPYLLFSWAVCLTVVLQHRDNLQRILAGTERKIGQRAERREPSKVR